MDLNASIQQFVERLHDINRYLLLFPEEKSPMQLDQYEIIKIYIKPRLLNGMKQW
jgi:hypothetical protein